MYREWAEQPFFPGRKQIQNSQALLDRLLDRQDSHSLILNYLKYQSRLPKLVKSMAVLHKFHDHELSFWQIFVDKMQAFEINLDQIRKDQKLFAAYNRLLEIMHASSL